MRIAVALCLSILVGYSASIAANSTASASTLVSFGVEVTLADRFGMIRSEWLGLGATYLPIYFVLMTCLLLLFRRLIRGQSWSLLMTHCVYGAVSGLGLVVFILIFEQVMGVEGALLASTRQLSGLAIQFGCAALTGLCFSALLSRLSLSPSTSD
jgi:hypothetical protein